MFCRSLSFHPNIVKLLAYTENPRYIVTPLFPTDLARFLRDTPLAVPETLGMAIDIASAGTSLHDMGIVHRDLKSSNILVRIDKSKKGATYTPVVCDFGLARVVSESRLPVMKFETFRGMSPAYTPADGFIRFRSNREATTEEAKKSDVYAFGVILWELLTRRVPWQNVSSADLETRVCAGETLPLPEKTGNTQFDFMIDMAFMCFQATPSVRPSFTQLAQALAGKRA